MGDNTGRSTTPSDEGLRKSLGTLDGIGVLVGITIGAGIYSTPQLIAGYLSSLTSILILWFGVGILATVGSLVYAELGTRLPHTGGEYVYISRCFGPHLGFIFGWAQLIIIRTSPGAALSLVAADYLGYFVPMSSTLRTVTALLVLATLGFFNYVGIERASAFQKVATSLKLAGILLLSGVGLVFLTGAPRRLTSMDWQIPATLPPLSVVSAVMMLIVFSYTGWDRVGYVAGEMKQPRHVIPRTMIFGMGLIVGCYLILNILYHTTLGMEGVRSSKIVASDTAVQLFGATGAGFVALLVIISSISSTNGTIMTASRVYFAMAKDRVFFKWLGFVHPRFQTPSRAILVHCMWAAVILLVRQRFETIVAGMAFAVLIFYAATGFALFKLRKNSTGGEGAFRVPLYPILPAVYLAVILLLILLRIVFEFEKSAIDLLYIGSGIPFAFYWCRRIRSS
jgi:APA family basic amino acid/polyamine antiporter